MIFSSSQAVYTKHFTLPSCNLLFTALKRILLFHPDPIEFFHVEIHYFWNLSPNCTFLFSTLLLFLMLILFVQYIQYITFDFGCT